MQRRDVIAIPKRLRLPSTKSDRPNQQNQRSVITEVNFLTSFYNKYYYDTYFALKLHVKNNCNSSKSKVQNSIPNWNSVSKAVELFKESTYYHKKQLFFRSSKKEIKRPLFLQKDEIRMKWLIFLADKNLFHCTMSSVFTDMNV